MMKSALVVLVVGLAYAYLVPPKQVIEPVLYSITLPKFEGPLAPNNALDKAEHLHENSIQSPESLAVYKNQIYTGLSDGRIVKVTGKKATEVVRTGEKCELQYEEHKCGRPLGMRFDKAGQLFVADAYLGLFSVNVKTSKKENILPSTKLVDGLRLTFLNSIALDEENSAIYFTQSSTRWNFSQAILSLIDHDQTGRLLKYELKSKAVSVILKDLSFPNGVVFTHDGTALLVSIGNSNKIFKYHVKGPKKGTREELPLVLPGEPDNLTPTSRGTYWVAVPAAREGPSLLDHLSPYPDLRKAILHTHRMCPLVQIANNLPHRVSKNIGLELESMRILLDILPMQSMAIEFDDSGKILRSFQSSTKTVKHITEALELDGHLYLGSWRNPYLGKLKL